MDIINNNTFKIIDDIEYTADNDLKGGLGGNVQDNDNNFHRRNKREPTVATGTTGTTAAVPTTSGTTGTTGTTTATENKKEEVKTFWQKIKDFFTNYWKWLVGGIVFLIICIIIIFLYAKKNIKKLTGGMSVFSNNNSSKKLTRLENSSLLNSIVSL